MTMPTTTLAESCEQCEDPIPLLAGPVVTIEGERLCPRCAAEVPRCDECAVRARDRALTVHDTSRCTECRIGWTQCGDCDRYSRETTAIIGGSDVCESCAENYTRCDDCGDRAAVTVTVEGDRGVCEPCEREDYHPCADCSTLIRDSYTYCDDCADTSTGHAGIHTWDYKPTPVFHGRGPLFLGLELELKLPRGVLSEAADTAIKHLGGLGYLKEDGSISPWGFELVTHPMSPEFAREEFPWGLLTRLRLLGAYTDDTVGIHVHLSRAGFSSPAHAYRWLKFVYRNEAPVTTLARRRHSQWAEFTPAARARAVTDAKGLRDPDHYIPRYQAVNVQPAETFELRIFASSVKPQQVKAALGFAAASVEYTRELSAAQIARRRGWEWAAFTAWVANRRPDYSALYSEMEALQCAS
ncbi:hypothetical protein [Nocardia sp. NPDC057227]|uniref:hypothetical protein n=1 Tax=Nocardia sp. NPDC057227 TaxID=3346056 RepID=UPI00363AEEC1